MTAVEDRTDIIPSLELHRSDNLSSTNQLIGDDEKEIFDYSSARIFLKRLIDDWRDEINLTDERRKTRDIDVDVRALRASGKLDEDETLIPDRVVDNNIVREQPPYI